MSIIILFTVSNAWKDDLPEYFFKTKEREKNFVFGSSEYACRKTVLPENYPFHTAAEFALECADLVYEPTSECLHTASYIVQHQHPLLCGVPSFPNKSVVRFNSRDQPVIVTDFMHLRDGRDDEFLLSLTPDPDKGCSVACSVAVILTTSNTYIETTEDCTAVSYQSIQGNFYVRNLDSYFGEEKMRVYDTVDAVERLRILCQLRRQEELEKFFLKVYRKLGQENYDYFHATKTESRKELPTVSKYLFKRRKKKSKLAILIALDPNSIPRYQDLVNIWQCYARRRNHEFILDTNLGDVQRTSYYWLRWFAVKKHLPFFDHVFVVDPDSFVVPECWRRSLETVFSFQNFLEIRDVAPRQTLNDASVLLKNSVETFIFLDSLLEKVDWTGTFMFDQGAFDETVLEFLDLELRVREKLFKDLTRRRDNVSLSHRYRSECLVHILPNALGSWSIPSFHMCYWDEMEKMIGKFGERRSRWIGFINPKNVDINHVVGVRGVEEPALIQHFAGPGKVLSDILGWFFSTPEERKLGKNFETPSEWRYLAEGNERQEVPQRFRQIDTSKCENILRFVDRLERKFECICRNEGVRDFKTYCEEPLLVC